MLVHNIVWCLLLLILDVWAQRLSSLGVDTILYMYACRSTGWMVACGFLSTSNFKQHTYYAVGAAPLALFSHSLKSANGILSARLRSVLLFRVATSLVRLFELTGPTARFVLCRH